MTLTGLGKNCAIAQRSPRLLLRAGRAQKHRAARRGPLLHTKSIAG